MSRTRPTRFDLEKLSIPCPYCGSGVGEWCTKPSGAWSAFQHSGRFYAATGRHITYAGVDQPRDAIAAARLNGGDR